MTTHSNEINPTQRQLEALECVASGKKPLAIWRQSLNALMRQRLITLTVAGYSVTSKGLQVLAGKRAR